MRKRSIDLLHINKNQQFETLSMNNSGLKNNMRSFIFGYKPILSSCLKSNVQEVYSVGKERGEHLV